MNPELKQKWIDALRSGTFKQGREYLKCSDGSYCCLGVLAELEQRVFTFIDDFEDNDSLIIDQTQFLHEHPELDESIQETLASMNDGTGEYREAYSFEQIADWIEKNL